MKIPSENPLKPITHINNLPQCDKSTSEDQNSHIHYTPLTYNESLSDLDSKTPSRITNEQEHVIKQTTEMSHRKYF